jgi:GNAT superfamily N-acetyltransferase
VIRAYDGGDFAALAALINAAAEAYRGIIPPDRWHEPYMPGEELAAEIAAGVAFQLYDEGGGLVGAMGVQEVKDVSLIRHAYVAPEAQRRGVGSALLESCRARAERPLLIGTWAAAEWAIRFYEKHGFRVTAPAEKDRLLRTYWTIPERQIETSVVLAEALWFAESKP